jgi:hypothetical protein
MDLFAREHGFFKWFYVSSKTNFNVEEAFQCLINEILNVTKGLEIQNPDKKTEGTVRIDEKEENNEQKNYMKEWKEYCCT